MGTVQNFPEWIQIEVAMRPKLGPERRRRVIEILAEADPR